VLPWIVILLLSLVLFIVAATIVLSLIAVFLPTRNVNVASTSSGPQQITIQLSSDSSLATGPINETEQTSLENEVRFNIRKSCHILFLFIDAKCTVNER